MKRAGNLWDGLVSWDNLLDSALAAAAGKRSRPDVAQFLFRLEPNLCQLQRELKGGQYAPGAYRTFWIQDPKARLISAAPFRDRVVHHALTRVLEEVFEPRFMPSSFASRKGFGQHQALNKARAAVGEYRYVLKCDIRKYFPSIDHRILKDLVARAVKCKPTLALAERIVDGSNHLARTGIFKEASGAQSPLPGRDPDVGLFNRRQITTRPGLLVAMRERRLGRHIPFSGRGDSPFLLTQARAAPLFPFATPTDDASGTSTNFPLETL